MFVFAIPRASVQLSAVCRRAVRAIAAAVTGILLAMALTSPCPVDARPRPQLDRRQLVAEIRRKLSTPLERVATPTLPMQPTPAATPVPTGAANHPTNEAAATAHPTGRSGWEARPIHDDPGRWSQPDADGPSVEAAAPPAPKPRQNGPASDDIPKDARVPDANPRDQAGPEPGPANAAGPDPGSDAAPPPAPTLIPANGATGVATGGRTIETVWGDVASVPARLPEIAAQLEAAMRLILIEPASMTVAIEPVNAFETARGRFARVTVTTVGGALDHLRLQSAQFVFNQVRLDLPVLFEQKKIETKEVGSVDLDVILTESDLNSYLQTKAKKIKVDNPRVELKSNDIVVSGSTRYGFIKANFWATGNFSIRSPDKVHFMPRRFKINSVSVPKPFLRSIVDRINPVLDLAKFPFKLNLAEIRLEKGQMRFLSQR